MVDALAHLLGEVQLHVRDPGLGGEGPPGAVGIGAEVRDAPNVGREDRLRLGLGDLAAAGHPSVGLFGAVAGDHHTDLLVAEAALRGLTSALAGLSPLDAAATTATASNSP